MGKPKVKNIQHLKSKVDKTAVNTNNYLPSYLPYTSSEPVFPQDQYTIGSNTTNNFAYPYTESYFARDKALKDAGNVLTNTGYGLLQGAKDIMLGEIGGELLGKGARLASKLLKRGYKGPTLPAYYRAINSIPTPQKFYRGVEIPVDSNLRPEQLLDIPEGKAAKSAQLSVYSPNRYVSSDKLVGKAFGASNPIVNTKGITAEYNLSKLNPYTITDREAYKFLDNKFGQHNYSMHEAQQALRKEGVDAVLNTMWDDEAGYQFLNPGDLKLTSATERYRFGTKDNPWKHLTEKQIRPLGGIVMDKNKVNKNKIDPRYADMRLKSAWASDIIHQPNKASGLDYVVGYLDPITRKQPITYSQLLDMPTEVKNKYGVNNTLQPFFNAYKGLDYYDQKLSNQYGLGGIIGGLAGSIIPGIGTTIGGMIGTGIDSMVGGIKNRNAQQDLNNQNLSEEIKQRIQKTNMLQSQTYNPYSVATFPYGGMINGGVPVQLEKQETFIQPNGQMGQVNAPSHAQGGIDMNLQPNTEIFSDRLKPKWDTKLKSKSGKTFADESKTIMRELEKYNKILES